MLNDLFSKKKKKNQEQDEYEDDGNFSYNEDLKTNEFNDATIEYGDGEEIQDDDSTDFEEEPEDKKHKILFYALIGFLILLLLIVLMIRGCYLKDGTLKSISIDAPNIIYVGEKTQITVKASGKNNLKKTSYKFDTSNNSIVDIDARGYLQGKVVKNNLIPITTGRFVLEVSAQLNDVKLPNVEKEIVICRKLSEDSFSSKELTAVIGKSIKLNVDLGEDNECITNLNYEIKDKNLVKIDESGNLVGLKEGKTEITFTSGKEKITKKVNVVTNDTKVTGLLLDKTTLNLTVGETATIKSTIEPNNATNKNIKWQSNNTGIATVTQTGKITATGKGTAIIKAVTEDGEYTKTVTVNVKEKQQTGGNTGGNTTPSKDTTAPKITKVTIKSDNTYNRYATIGNTITLEMNVSESLSKAPSVKIAGQAVSTRCSNQTCIATYYVTSSSKQGKVSINIEGYKDNAGNTGAVVTNTTDSTSVTIDTIRPVCEVVSATASGDSTYVVKFNWKDNSNGSGIKEAKITGGGTYNANGYIGQDKSGTETVTYTRGTSDSNKTLTATDWAGNTCSATISIPKKGSSSTTTNVFNVKYEPITINPFAGSTIATSTIGKTSDQCTTQGTSCTVTLPSITPKNGFEIVGWATSKTATTGLAPGSKLTLTKDVTYYAITKQKSSSGGSSGGGIYVPTECSGNETKSCTKNGKSCTCTCSGGRWGEPTNCRSSGGSTTNPTITATLTCYCKKTITNDKEIKAFINKDNGSCTSSSVRTAAVNSLKADCIGTVMNVDINVAGTVCKATATCRTTKQGSDDGHTKKFKNKQCNEISNNTECESICGVNKLVGSSCNETKN